MFMHMDIRLLEAFRAVMDSQSVTGAARRLGVSQPAVSAQIARLETHVGFELFERVGGRLKASPAGRRFHAEVTTALDMIERLEDTAKDIRSGASESVVVASHPSASISLLPGVVSELRRLRPDARVRMINRTSEEVRAIFEAGGVDVAVAEWPVNLPGIEIARYEVPSVAILPEGHPLAERACVGPADLAGTPFVAMPASRLFGHRVRDAFLEQGIGYEPVIESEYFSTICGLVAAGCGASVVDLWSAETFRRLGLRILRFEPDIPYEIAVFRHAGRPRAPLADEIARLIGRRLTSADAGGPRAVAPVG